MPPARANTRAPITGNVERLCGGSALSSCAFTSWARTIGHNSNGRRRPSNHMPCPPAIGWMAIRGGIYCPSVSHPSGSLAGISPASHDTNSCLWVSFCKACKKNGTCLGRAHSFLCLYSTLCTTYIPVVRCPLDEPRCSVRSGTGREVGNQGRPHLHAPPWRTTTCRWRSTAVPAGMRTKHPSDAPPHVERVTWGHRGRVTVRSGAAGVLARTWHE